VDPAVIAALYVRHGDELRAFLVGVLGDGHLAADVVQATFAKAIEQGHLVKEESLKSWVFQVAYREALAVRRRDKVHQQALVAQSRAAGANAPQPADQAVSRETIERVRRAIASLPAEQREVVRLRMYEGHTFAHIAASRGIPLGTVLSRMQSALKKLRDRLEGAP
jgi:RNA polymerase sigma-70 factor (ECF subfamily)